MFIEFKEEALHILSYSYPMVLIAIIIASSLRITYLIINKEKFILYKELFKLSFIIYILCLFHAVTYQDVSFSNANFIPFKEITRYDFGSSLFYRNILGNLLLFIPFGIFSSHYVKINKSYIVIILSFIASLSIELTQLLIGRVFDVDDIILNVMGGLIGYIIYKIFKKFENNLPNIFRNDLVRNIVSIIITGGLIWFLIR